MIKNNKSIYDFRKLSVDNILCEKIRNLLNKHNIIKFAIIGECIANIGDIINIYNYNCPDYDNFFKKIQKLDGTSRSFVIVNSDNKNYHFHNIDVSNSKFFEFVNNSSFNYQQSGIIIVNKYGKFKQIMNYDSKEFLLFLSNRIVKYIGNNTDDLNIMNDILTLSKCFDDKVFKYMKGDEILAVILSIFDKLVKITGKEFISDVNLFKYDISNQENPLLCGDKVMVLLKILTGYYKRGVG